MGSLLAYIAARGPRDTRAVPRGGNAGSGTAIGVAVLFPALMVFIMAFDSMTAVSRTGEAVQSAADRAARAASLCCLHVDDAEQAARDSVEWLESAASQLDLGCSNDLSQSAAVHFEDPDGATVGKGERVPEGGTVQVRLECDVAHRALGNFAMLRVEAERSGVGTAAIDPYRYRAAPAPVLPASGLHLECHAGNHTQLTLHWADPDDGRIVSYEYRMRHGSDSSSIGNWGSWTAIPLSTGTTTSHTFGGLNPGHEYHFQLQAVFDDGTTEQGPQNAAGFVRGLPGKRPKGPAGYRAVGGPKMVTLEWDDPAEHPSAPDSTITGYRYKLRKQGGGWRPGNDRSVNNAKSIPGGTTSYSATREYDSSGNSTASELSDSHYYRFVLYAVNGCGASNVIRPDPTDPIGPVFVQATPTS